MLAMLVPIRLPRVTLEFAALAAWTSVALLSLPAALAAGHDPRERVARKACLEGDYAKGVSVLSDLFLDTNDSTYIYNQGRCLEQNGRFADAVLRFKEYLRVGGQKLGRAERAEAEKHIADSQSQLEPRSPEPEPSALTPKSVTPPTVVAQSSTEPATPAIGAIALPPPQSERRSASGPPVVALATAGIGAAGLVTGVILNLKANSIANSYATRGGYTEGKEAQRSTYETIGWVGYGVGSACVVAGAILYIWGRRSGPSDSANVALFPSVGSNLAGAVVSGAF
jgi:hypothetical protein